MKDKKQGSPKHNKSKKTDKKQTQKSVSPNKNLKDKKKQEKVTNWRKSLDPEKEVFKDVVKDPIIKILDDDYTEEVKLP